MPVYKISASNFSSTEREEFVGDEGRLFYELDIDGVPLFYISDGDTVGGIPVVFGDSGGINQTLSLNGTELSIARGNTIDLSSIDTTLDMSSLTTDMLAEGAANLYYTDNRVATYIANNPITSLDYNVLINAPTTITGYGITDAFDGQYSSLTGSPANVSAFTNDAGYLTSYIETDPIYSASPSATITTTNIGNWNTAFNWGDHSLEGYITGVTFAQVTNKPTTITGYGITDAFDGQYSSLTGSPINISTFTNDTGYLTSYTETDPTVPAHVKAITTTNITNWDNAFSWGNHASAGYLTSYTETDPIYSASPSGTITSLDITKWNTAFGWGNHATAGYLTSYTETDPIYSASPSATITTTNIGNWNTSFAWGNHATVGYLTDETNTSISINANVLTYTDETGSTTDIDLSLYIDDTNLARLVSGTLDSDTGIAKFTRDDASTFDLDLSSLLVNVFSGDYNDLTNTPVIPTVPTDVSAFTNDAGYLTSYTETDPIYSASPSATITTTNIGNWNTAYGWGDHSVQGYLNSFTETDPVFQASSAATITAGDITNWNNSFGWGDHSTQGYLTSYTETDPIFTASAASNILLTDITNWNTAFNWGDHNAQGYLTSYTETDPIFTASVAAGIAGTDVSNWNNSFAWGDHSTQGYLTTLSFADLTTTPTTIAGYGITDAFDGQYSSLTGSPTSVSAFTNDAGYLTSYTETDPIYSASPSATITTTNIGNWNTSFAWGDHATAGYLTSETTTSLSINANTLTYTDELGVTTDIDLSVYIDDTNLARLTSGTLDSDTGIATFTRDDASTFDLDLSSLLVNVFSGDYNDLTNTPVIPTVPTDVSAFTNDAGYITSVSFSDLTSTPTTIAGYGITDAFDGQYSSLTGSPTSVSAFTNDAGYLTSYTETNDLTSAVIWSNVPDVNITQSSVTQHQTALSITESQISDLQSYLTSETTTSLSINANTLTYTDETGSTTDLDLSLYIDDTNLARLVSGTLDSDTGIATFTRDDASTFTVDFSSLLVNVFSGDYNDLTNTPVIPTVPTNVSAFTNDAGYLTSYVDTNDFLDSLVFDTASGTLTAGVSSQTDVTVNLDGRYLLSTSTTDDISEGTTNLYYDDSLVANYITNNSLTQITIDGATLQWYGVDNTLQLVYNNGVTYELGQEEFMYIKSLDTISKGQVVMFAGALGTHLQGVRADQSVPGFQPEWIIGIAAQDFAVNEFGYVETFGKVTDIDTSMYTDGTILYMDPDNPGELTDIVPSAPDHIIQMAAVINAHSQQGAIFVRLTHKPDTDEVGEGINNLYYTEARFDESMKFNLSESAPVSSIGVPGDETGLIRADDTYIYYCWADYDGTTNIWKRVALSADTW